jgi:hypothetical protein
VLPVFVIAPTNLCVDPLNKILGLPLKADVTNVGFPYDVPLLPVPDLSIHVDIVALFAGITPFPAGSAPSSHNEHPVIEVGLKKDVFFKLILF